MKPKEIKRYTSMRHWEQVILDRKASGLTVKQYCENNNITKRRYYYWSRIIRDADFSSIEVATAKELEEPDNQPQFAKVELHSGNSASGITIRMRDSEIDIHPDSNPEHIRIIMEALIYAQRY